MGPDLVSKVNAVIDSALKAGLKLDNGNVIDLLADNIPAPLKDLRIALQISEFSGRWPRAETLGIKPMNKNPKRAETKITLRLLDTTRTGDNYSLWLFYPDGNKTNETRNHNIADRSLDGWREYLKPRGMTLRKRGLHEYDVISGVVVRSLASDFKAGDKVKSTGLAEIGTVIKVGKKRVLVSWPGRNGHYQQWDHTSYLHKADKPRRKVTRAKRNPAPRRFLTLAGVTKELSGIGISLSRRDGEYRVSFRGLTPDKAEASAYYTTDLYDARATGIDMAKRARATPMARNPRRSRTPSVYNRNFPAATEHESKYVICLHRSGNTWYISGEPRSWRVTMSVSGAYKFYRESDAERWIKTHKKLLLANSLVAAKVKKL